ncbi:MAG: chemotaxis protein CheC [Magnetococcales bacterium]|nr:chemotaxis protein CheC [Magnetococcales bacterium]
MTEISENEQDALKEFFNMGLGMAADSLSQMVNKEVLLSLPQLAVVSRSEAKRLVGLDENAPMVAIRQRFRGELNGTALLIFPGAKSLELVRTLLADSMPLEALTELEQETLLDVGNIILNAFLASFTDMMSVEFEFESAEFLRATCDQLLDIDSHLTDPNERELQLDQADSPKQAFFLMMDFKTGDEMSNEVSLHGYVVLLFTERDMAVLKKELQTILGAL